MRFLKLLLFLIVCTVLLLSAIQLRTGFIRESELNGVFRLAPEPDLKLFAWKSWFSGVFQEKFAASVNDHIGLRKTLIRIRNQADWSLFRVSHADGFIAGKEGFLFEEDYILEYTGKYFIGKQALDLKVRRLKAVQAALRARGVCLLPVIEPGKASFYPEYIPDRYRPDRRTQTNLDYLIRQMDAYGVNYIDLNRYFMTIKDTCRYKLFPEYGMHWSLYGVAVAMDTLSAFIRSECGLPVRTFEIERIEISDSLRGTDYDIGHMLNIICPLQPVTAAYPALKYAPEPQGGGIDLLAVGDSYFNNIYYDYAPHLFRTTDFWYYNSRYYSDDDRNGKPVDHSNLTSTLEKYDLILLAFSEINAHCGFWNFADQAWHAYYGGPGDSDVYDFENRIRNEREWFRAMVGKSAAAGTTLERTIRRDAIYMADIDRNSR